MYLLSGFFDIVILFGAMQGLIISLLLFFSKRNRVSNRLLAMLIFLLTLASLNIWLLHQQWYQSGLFQTLDAIVPVVVIMPVGPLLYFYTISMLHPEFSVDKRKRGHFYSAIVDLIPHLVAVFYIIGVIIGLLKNNPGPVAEFLDNYNVYADIPRWLSITVYAVLSFRYIIGYKKNGTGDIHNQLNWLRQLNTAFFIFQFIWLAYLIPYVIPALTDRVLHLLNWYPIYVPLSILIYWLGIKGYLMRQSQQTVLKRTKTLTLPDPETANKIVLELRRAMVADQLYLNPGLSINLLAKHIGIAPKTISTVINQHLNESFSDFVNAYRINTFKEKYLLPEYANFTIVGIAFECGFKSQPTFQRAFKQFTGCSPSDFKFSSESAKQT